MGNEAFPYGNDPQRPQDWVGSPETKSREWYVTYDGGFSLVIGYHSFIFMGLENMCIGIVNLKGGGPTLSLPVGKIVKELGRAGIRKIGDLIDNAGDAKTVHDIYERETEQAKIATGAALLERMGGGVVEAMIAREPFSFNDLNGMRGLASGADIELVGSASAYEISGGDGHTSHYFGPKVVTRPC